MSVLNDYRKTRLTLVNETLLLCGDPLGERFDPARAAEAVNDAILDFNLRTEMVKEEINIQVKENIYDYDVRLLVENDGSLRAYGFPLRVGFNGKEAPAHRPVSLFDIDMIGYSSAVWYRNSLSPNRIAIIPPSKDGTAPGDSDPYKDNIQVLYAALPTPMNNNGAYPDSKILALYHQAFPFGAASRLLDEGTLEELEKAIGFEAEFKRWCARAVAEEWRGQTDYGGCRPA